MSPDCAVEFSLSHDIITTPHYSCQEVSEEAGETSLDCVKLTVTRDNKIEDFTKLY